MKCNIKTTDIDMTDELSAYLEKRLSALDKFFNTDETAVSCDVEIGRRTEHHLKGNVFKAEINILRGGEHHYTHATEETLYAAIDKAKDEMARHLRRGKKKHLALARKGGAAIKRRVRGFFG